MIELLALQVYDALSTSTVSASTLTLWIPTQRTISSRWAERRLVKSAMQLGQKARLLCQE